MLTDIQIAQAARMLPITEVGAKLGIPAAQLEPYGHYKDAPTSRSFAKDLAG